MEPRALVKKTLDFDSPPRIPRQKWVLPWAEKRFPHEVRRLQHFYPDEIVVAPAVYKKPLEVRGNPYKPGEYLDEWGCRFYNSPQGLRGKVEEPLIKDWSELDDFKEPVAAFSLDKEKVNEFCRNTDKFVLAGTIQRPFERYQFIRSMNKALMDLVHQPPGFFKLLEKIHKFYCQELEVWAQTEIDAVFLMDDWGGQDRLFASPRIFRQLFKPLYQEYVNIARSYQKYVFMHSDGYIMEILPDFVELGINALNAQIFSLGIEELSEKFKGRLTFWGDSEGRYLLYSTPFQEVKNAVYKIWNYLYDQGGIIDLVEFRPGVKPENLFLFYETWKYIS